MNMDTEIISALISSIASIVCGTIGIYIGKNDSGKSKKKEILKQQLVEVFAPMDKLLNLEKEKSEQEIIECLKQIASEKYMLVPSILMEEIKRLGTYRNNARTLQDIETIVSTFYNWSCKRFGYPYTPEKINKYFIPTRERNVVIQACLESVFYSIWAISIAFTIFCLIRGDIPSGGQWFILLAAIGGEVLLLKKLIK